MVSRQEKNAQRKQEIDGNFADVNARQDQNDERVGYLENEINKLKRAQGYMGKGSHIVVEGCTRLEALWGESEAMEEEGYENLKKKAPAELAHDMAKHLGLAMGESEPNTWTQTDVNNEGEQKEAAGALFRFYRSMAARGTVVNVHEGMHRPDGPESDRVRKEDCFTIQLDHGLRMFEIKASLVECLETEMRLHSGLPCRSAEPLPDLPDAGIRRHFLVYCEPTEEQKWARKGNKDKGKGKGKGGKKGDGKKGGGNDKGKGKVKGGGKKGKGGPGGRR